MRQKVLVCLSLGIALFLISSIVCLEDEGTPSEPSQEELEQEPVTDASVALPEETAEPAAAETEPITESETPPAPEEEAQPETAPVPEPEPTEEPAPAPVEAPAPVAAPAPKPAAPSARPAAPAPAPVSVTPAPTAAPVVPAQPATDAQVEKVGIDTLSINEQGGNWLLKRIWYEKALQRYEKIKSLVDEVLDSRTTFLNKRTELDRTLFEPFLNEIGLEMGELQGILKEYMDKLEELRKKEGGSLNAQELEFANRLGAEKDELEKAQADVKTVLDVDNALDDALAKLMEQINLCRNYEKQALQNFKEIAKILDDKKARDLYYEMETHLSNIKAILDYIQHPFAQHFSSLETKARELTDNIKKSIQALKEKGIEFKSKENELEEASKQAAAPESEGFGSKIMNGFSYVTGLVKSAAQWFWNGVVSGYEWVRSFFGGPAEEVNEPSGKRVYPAGMVTPAAPHATAVNPEQPALAPVQAPVPAPEVSSESAPTASAPQVSAAQLDPLAP